MIYRLIDYFRRRILIIVLTGGPRNAMAYNRIQRLMKKGLYDRAVNTAEKNFKRISLSHNRNLFKFFQFWQFFLEKTYYMAGRARVSDPLFECRAEPLAADDISLRENGICGIIWTHLGLLISGVVFDRSVRRARITIDGQFIRSIPVRRLPFLPGYIHYHIKREVLKRFPREPLFELQTSDKRPLMCAAGRAFKLTVPHGAGDLLEHLRSGASINKKGFFAPVRDNVAAMQSRYLKIYDRARDYFDSRFGSPLFLLYGTLLGSYRQGDFIPGDDDFDGGYISRKTGASEVKKETMDLVVDLVLNGFVCSFNRKGRLFRLRLKDDPPEVYLDLRPVWYERGSIWAHKQACLPLSIDDFLPVSTAELRGTKVYHPRNTEAFLLAYYGPGWRVPDPTYSNASQSVTFSVARKLDSICITPADYAAMSKQIEERRSGFPDAGCLFSAGMHGLYPLDEYEKRCEW